MKKIAQLSALEFGNCIQGNDLAVSGEIDMAGRKMLSSFHVSAARRGTKTGDEQYAETVFVIYE